MSKQPFTLAKFRAPESGFSQQFFRAEESIDTVRAIVDQETASTIEYCTHSDDRAGNYTDVVQEGFGHNVGCVETWLLLRLNSEKSLQSIGSNLSEVSEKMKISLEQFTDHANLVYLNDDYNEYDGNGCCFASVQFEAYECCLDFEDYPGLAALHLDGELKPIVAHLMLQEARVSSTELTFEIDIPGQWHWVVPEVEMEYFFKNALKEIFARFLDSQGL